MKTLTKLLKIRQARSLVIMIATGILCINLSSYKTAGIANKPVAEVDTTGSAVLKNVLGRPAQLASLYFPKSVLRFYAANGYSPMWINRNANPKITWEAMLMLDCVLQF